MATPTSSRPKRKVVHTEHPHIVRAEGKRGGEPIIQGSSISVWIIAGLHQMGDSIEDILETYPRLAPASVYDALSYYYDHQEEIDQRLAENKNAHADFETHMKRKGYERNAKGVYRLKLSPKQVRSKKSKRNLKLL